MKGATTHIKRQLLSIAVKSKSQPDNLTEVVNLNYYKTKWRDGQ